MTSTLNPQILARKAGFLYLLLVPLGIYSLIYVPDLIRVTGNPAATMEQLLANEFSFRWSILGALAIQVVQLFVALALYDLLKIVHKRMAALIVFFTVTAMPIAMLNELSHVAILYALNDPDLLTLFTQAQIDYWVSLALNLNSDGIMIAHVFWGFWLFPMGYLIAKSGFVPRIIGWLLMLECFGYLADTLIWILLPESTLSVADYTGWGELFLPLWLVIKGVNLEQWNEWNAKNNRNVAV
jgi:hypothetical protein